MKSIEKLMKSIEKLSIRICERLPLDITLYEKDGLCQKSSEECEYCRKHGQDFLCYKKTYQGRLMPEFG